MHLLRFATVLPFTALFCFAQDAEIVLLREKISKLVDIQSLESQERNDWKAKKADYSALMDLHNKEIELLDQELGSSGNSAPSHDEATQSMKTEIDQLKASRRQAQEAVARNVPRALALVKQLPNPLLKDCETEIFILKNWKVDQDPRDVLPSILSVLEKAQQFDRRFTRSSEVQNGKEVEILYLGLSCAFYADGTKSAGVGRPSKDGWVWKEKPEIRSELLSAFNQLEKTRPPAMVQLPLKLN